MKIILDDFVLNSARQHVVDSFTVIKNCYLSNNKIIALDNQLREDAPLAIKNHETKHSQLLNPKDVCTYIAASSLSHTLDGWGYLSSSVNSLMNGNLGAAIHLAYYAELRAVMSILASEGIGVFNNKHIGLTGGNSFTVLSNSERTHVFVWEALEKWSTLQHSTSHDFLKIFKVNGYDFVQLVHGFHPSATQIASSGIIKSWLIKWAFDVKKYRNDREKRNFVSYRPQVIQNFSNQVDFKNIIINVYDLLHVLSPLESNPFNYLDKLLLRDLFQELSLRPAISGKRSFEELVENAFSNIGANLDNVTSKILFSKPPYNKQHVIFEESSKLETTPLSIISRAALLLRISTGCVSTLLKDAKINKSDLNFIWGNYGFNSGFWETVKPVEAFYELWTEIESEFSDISNNMHSINNNPYQLKSELNEDLNLLSQFNRAALWGV